MTITTETITTEAQRVYIRGIGSGTLVKTHHDHSATVRFDPDTPFREEGGEEHVAFGDWVIEPVSRRDDEHNEVTFKEVIRSRLELDLGESFCVTNSGIGPGLKSWFRALYGDCVVSITIESAAAGPAKVPMIGPYSGA